MTYLASSAGALIVDRNTWASRANQAWGPSDVWNSGNSWEYLTGYHGWVGRTYNVGESWEAAYNRVYTDRYNEGYAAGDAAGRAAMMPAGSGSTPETWNSGNASWPASGTMTWSAGASGAVSGNSGGTITLAQDGYYVIRVRATFPGGATGAYSELRLFVNGSLVDTSRVSDTVGGQTKAGPAYEGVVGGGRTVRVDTTDTAGGMPSAALFITFVPTVSYPH